MDRSLITSGFDIELLIGNRYIEYLLLSLNETGSIPPSVAAGPGMVDIFQPSDVDRLYDPHPDAVPLTASERSFDCELIFNHPSGGNVRIDLEVLNQNQFLTLFATFGLALDGSGRSVLRIDVKAVEFSPGLKALMDAQGTTEEDVLRDIKADADRDVPLPFVGATGDIERVEMRQLPSMDGGPVALAFYLNMRLRNGPRRTDFLPARGDPLNGMNFLEHGQDIAFAVRLDFLRDLSAHQKFLFAREKSNGEFDFPLRRNMFDPDAEPIGKLFDVTIGPNRINGQITGNIDIRIRGEYQIDNFFDPDFTFTLTLIPIFRDGVVTWSHSTDLDVPLGSVFAFILLGFVGLIAFNVVADELSGSLVGDTEREQMATFLESLPVRVPTETIRWDPFYETVHQVVTRVEEWLVDHLGIAFSGRAALDRQTRPVDHIVLRTETRTALGDVDRLAYRVRDHARHADTLKPDAIFSATDRLTFRQVESEPDLFALLPAEAVERIGAGKLIGPQELLPMKVHLDNHQIHRMLCITPREVEEQAALVKDRFRREARLRILSTQGDDLREQARQELRAELGTEPTPQQVQARLERLIADIVGPEFDAYVVSPAFEADLDAAVDAVCRLDLSPNEFGLLQRGGVVRVVGFDLILRRNRKVRPGTTTLYYRDRADFDPSDNLLNKVRYTLQHREPQP
ncbi:hypothetical protein BH23GEM9_BH23GEM9_08490 [soil metagenome]